MLKPIDQGTMLLVSGDANACKRWKVLARHLQVKETLIKNIAEDEAQDIEECCHQSLVEWQQENASHASIRKLLKALTQARLSAVALKLLE